MKSIKLVLLGVFSFCVMAIVSISIILANQLSSESTVSKDCPKTYAKHTIVIKDNIASPKLIFAAKCDTLTIINQDDKARLMAFGSHDHHVEVDGVEQRYLTKDKTFTITLAETGKFTIHDHYQDEVEATFDVSN